MSKSSRTSKRSTISWEIDVRHGLFERPYQRSNAGIRALRLTAQCVSRSDNKIGEFCRRLNARLGKAEGSVATAHSAKMGSIAIIEKRDYRSPEAMRMEPDRARHYKARSSAERSNSDLKDNHGGA